MDGWNTRFLLGWLIFRCYVSFRECKQILIIPVLAKLWESLDWTFSLFFSSLVGREHIWRTKSSHIFSGQNESGKKHQKAQQNTILQNKITKNQSLWRKMSPKKKSIIDIVNQVARKNIKHNQPSCSFLFQFECFYISPSKRTFHQRSSPRWQPKLQPTGKVPGSCWHALMTELFSGPRIQF